MGRHRLSTAVLSLWLGSVAWSVPKAAAPQVPAPAHGPASEREVLDRYCVSCHNDRLKTSGLSLEKLDAAHATANPELWENVARKLQARAMPPQGARRPDEATYRALETAIEAQLDADAAAHPNPGAPILHRLNRSEYANAVRDLLALDVDVTSLLPPDDAAYGFDNISDALGRVAVAAGALSVGRGEDRGDRRRRPRHHGGERHVPHPAGSLAGSARRRIAARHDRRHGGPVHVPARRRLRVSGEALSHEPEHHARASNIRTRSSSRSTARRVYAATIGGPDDLDVALRQADRHERRRRCAAAGARAGDRRAAHGVGGVRRRSARAGAESPAAVPSQLDRQLRLGRDVRTCRRSRLPVRSTRPALATRRAAGRSSRASRRPPQLSGMRGDDPVVARTSRVSRTCERRSISSASCGFTRKAADRRHVRERHRSRAACAFSRRRASSSASSAIRATRCPVRRIG